MTPELRRWIAGHDARTRLGIIRMWKLESVWWRKNNSAVRRHMRPREARRFLRSYIRGARGLPPLD